ncbi:hypothetical protein [Sorangium cellulosum]|uniref:hypothetical protein n=1 Tax=Sorangium cellulosum TaxID=56 RepID=UPI001331A659|nr:hypothetical protein [Sorangium cellulosum]
MALTPALATAFLTACAEPAPSGDAEGVEPASSALTAQDRLDLCAQDPRVIAGLVSAQVCAGADLFFRETFEGNGRSCGTCHPVGNNFTIDVPFINALDASNPFDPLFVADNDADIAGLETPSLRAFGLILENVDGFEDLDKKFSLRSVPHTLSLALTLEPDPADGSSDPPVHRTGWSGDGAPGDGSLRAFLTGAIKQHYPTDLAREVDVAFRLPTEQELDLVEDFQLSLGRTNEINLQQVNLADPDANAGRLAFMDPAKGRCNVCHFNGGANHQVTGLNRNFDTGTRLAPLSPFDPEGDGVFDGGFGGQNLTSPNFDVLGDLDPGGLFTGFGDGKFNTPPVIEAVDNPPFFHTNAFGSLEAAVAFYTGTQFSASPAAAELTAEFGSPISFGSDDISNMARFLRVLGAAFNLDIAKQRLQAAHTLVNQFHDTRADVQYGLMDLARVEIDDVLELFSAPELVTPLHTVAQTRLQEAKSEIAAGLAATTWSQRQSRISAAISRVQSARDQFGSNINFQLGQGNLMY